MGTDAAGADGSTSEGSSGATRLLIDPPSLISVQFVMRPKKLFKYWRSIVWRGGEVGVELFLLAVVLRMVVVTWRVRCYNGRDLACL